MLSGDAFIHTFHNVGATHGGFYVGSLNPYFENDKDIVKYA